MASKKLKVFMIIAPVNKNAISILKKIQEIRKNDKNFYRSCNTLAYHDSIYMIRNPKLQEEIRGLRNITALVDFKAFELIGCSRNTVTMAIIRSFVIPRRFVCDIDEYLKQLKIDIEIKESEEKKE